MFQGFKQKSDKGQSWLMGPLISTKDSHKWLFAHETGRGWSSTGYNVATWLLSHPNSHRRPYEHHTLHQYHHLPKTSLGASMENTFPLASP